MKNTRLIAEFGSCHMGKLDRMIEAVDLCKKYGINALKFQLFPNNAPYVPTNIWLDPAVFKIVFDYAKMVGVDVSSSVFDETSFNFLLQLKPSFIKFSYGKKDQINWINKTLENHIEAIVSCDVMTDHLIPKEATKLYCIPEYPVRYEVDFDTLFRKREKQEVLGPNDSIICREFTTTGRFNGFSDHTLGFKQTIKAIKSGAGIIEKHIRLGYHDEICPDAFFAVNLIDFAKIREQD